MLGGASDCFRIGFPEIRYYDNDGAQAYIFANDNDAVVVREPLLEAAHHVPLLVRIAAFIAMAVGLGPASLFYIARPALPDVQAYAGEGAELVEIEISLVRADGSQDLEAEYSPAPRTSSRGSPS